MTDVLEVYNKIKSPESNSNIKDFCCSASSFLVEFMTRALELEKELSGIINVHENEE